MRKFSMHTAYSCPRTEVAFSSEQAASSTLRGKYSIATDTMAEMFRSPTYQVL